MHIIGNSLRVLEHSAKSFTIEVLATVLKPEWLRGAAAEATRPTERHRSLPGPFVVWLVIAMGLFRTLSIQNVLRRLGKALGTTSLWGEEVPASASAAEARNRLGFGATITPAGAPTVATATQGTTVESLRFYPSPFSPADYSRAMTEGVDDFLTKPLDIDLLWVRLKLAERISKLNGRLTSLEETVRGCPNCSQQK